VCDRSHLKTRTIGMFICEECDGTGGYFVPHVIDGSPVELSEWEECISCDGAGELVLERLPGGKLRRAGFFTIERRYRN
jgi:hypothetical protein